MIEFVVAWIVATWQVVLDSALYFIIGLTLAGLVWVFLNEDNLVRLLGKGKRQVVVRAALVGVPLPLCSCSVLPVVSQLRNSGLSRGGTVSFLIATPESSIDSILLTYSLTDPLLTVARPVAAFLTATAAGLLENLFDSESPSDPMVEDAVSDHDCDCPPQSPEPAGDWYRRIVPGIKHSFTTIMSDLAPYLLLGYLLAGLAAVAFGSPVDFGSSSGWWAYLVALVIGVPMYICATSSTPLAAVLLGAGFPPGAIMVFLMVGPATNLATLAVTKRILGLMPTVRYVASIVVLALLFGFGLDWLYGWFNMEATYQAASLEHGPHWLSLAAGVVLSGLILYHSGRKFVRRLTS